MVKRAIGQYLLFTKFMGERNSLSACMSRLGSGFTPPNELSTARYHLQNIHDILNELDRIKDGSKNDEIVLLEPTLRDGSPEAALTKNLQQLAPLYKWR